MLSAMTEMISRLLTLVRNSAEDYLGSVNEHPVRTNTPDDDLRRRFGVPLGREGREPAEVIEALIAAAERGLVATTGPRFFGYVMGGATPVAIAADWLTSAWDQHGGFHAASPASAVCEEVVASWLRDLFNLPSGAGAGFVTGCSMANFSGLAAARHGLLARAGWDVEALGLRGAPPLHIVAGEEAHVTIYCALRLLGFGTASVHEVAADAQGRMCAELLEGVLRQLDGPAIVCAQAGNVNSGAFDDFETICEVTHRYGGWVHVDGAFGFWAGASPRQRHHTRAIELADSWAFDAHKWLNVPHDSGLIFVRDASALRGAMRLSASYLQQSEGVERDGCEWVPEATRRARGFVLWAALQALGRDGIAEMIDRCCRMAARFADRFAGVPNVSILNDVALNVVLLKLQPPEIVRPVVELVQRDGVCWVGSTVWHGVPAVRICVSAWNTTEADIDRSADAVLAAYRQVQRTVAGVGTVV
jgi:glutamate/tyrosine decarboxylase-like PLP-dependent enzyme